MSIRPWLDGFCARLRQDTRRRAQRSSTRRSATPAGIQKLEDRTLLTTSVQVTGGHIQIFGDANENVTLRESPQQAGFVDLVIDNTSSGFLTGIPTSAITAVTIVTGPSENIVDVSGLTSSAFPNITSISIFTGNGDDTITGSPDFPNVVDAGDGVDVINGGLQNDTLNGGDGNDIITGFSGDDSLSGNDGDDEINGVDGNDIIVGGDGNDLISGGLGNDNVDGSDGDDIINGDAGDDTINGGFGNDIISGSDGVDSILGGSGDDSINGDLGADVLFGQGGVDTLNGGDDNDTLDGGTSADSLSGDAGDDSLLGTEGDDTLLGGTGFDTLLGGEGNDSLDGGNDDDQVFGNAGNDTVSGGGGADTVDGGVGNDVVRGIDAAIQIGDATASPEGTDGATVTLSFIVTLAQPQADPVTVQYTTLDDTATAGSDYGFASGTITFAPGQTQTSIPVVVNGDNTVEGDETFFVTLTGSSPGTTLADATGLGTIIDDDFNTSFATPILNVAGQGFNGVFPPDTIGDVGTNFYVQAINAPFGTSVQIYNKSDGSIAFPSFRLSRLAPLGTPGASGDGDPIVLYDSLADRWLLAEFTVATNDINVYISVNSTPTNNPADWYYYNFTAPSFPDYPKIGVWPNGYYVTTNEGSPAVYVFDRANMLLGQPARPFQRSTAQPLAGFGFQTLTPADVDGATAPSASAPGIFMRHRDDEAHNPGSNDPTQDFLEIYEYDTDFTTPSNTMFTLTQTIPVSEFDSDIGGLLAFSGISQPGGSLDPLREVIMHRLVYRNFGSYEVLLGNFSTDTNGADLAGIRWFELRKPAGSSQWSLYQEGTHTLSDNLNRWMGSIAMDDAGNITLAYSVSSSTVNPGLRYTGRLATDPLGVMTLPEGTIINGTSPQNFASRWGDYQALSIDPVDGSTFWFTGMYGTNGVWGTQVATFSLAGSNVTAGGGISIPPPAFPADAGDTLNGFSGNDTIIGGDGDDIINGGSGADLIIANGGNDVVNAGSQDDTIFGGDGNDTLVGQGGSDQVDGGNGQDVLRWDGNGDGLDTLTGGDGTDTALVNGSAGPDTFTVSRPSMVLNQILVSQGSSTLTINTSSISILTISGGANNDRVFVRDISRAGRVTLFVQGDDGDDLLDASAALLGTARLYLRGGLGADTIIGSAGDDHIEGDDGNDSLRGGSGQDTIDGGVGDDLLFGEGDGDVLIGGLDDDTINGGNGHDTINGGFDDDVINGGNGHDLMHGDEGDDIVNGNAGNDRIFGDTGRDTVIGGQGDDRIDGGRNDDVIRGNSGNDSITGGQGHDLIFGGADNDDISGGDGNDSIMGGNGADGISGNDGDDLLLGQLGSDTITGGDGDDTLRGGGSADTLIGNQGNDVINGNGGMDTGVVGEGLDPRPVRTEVIDANFVLSAAMLLRLDGV